MGKITWCLNAFRKWLAQAARKEIGHGRDGEREFVNLFTNWGCNHGHRQAAYTAELSSPPATYRKITLYVSTRLGLLFRRAATEDGFRLVDFARILVRLGLTVTLEDNHGTVEGGGNSHPSAPPLLAMS